jgi:hypothetical protein
VTLMALATLPTLVVVVVASLAEQDRLARRAWQDLAVLAELVGSSQEQLVEGTAQLLVAVSNAPAVTGGELQPCTQYLERLQDKSPGYANIGIISPQGKLTCRARSIAGDVQLGDRLYFRQALASGKLAIGEYIIGRTTGTRSINFGMPVRGDDGTARGIAFAAIDLAAVGRKLRAISIPSGISVLVSDAKGTVLADTAADPQRVGVPVEPVVLEAIRARASGPLDNRGAEASTRHHLLHPVMVSGSPGLFVVVSASRDAVLAPAVNSLLLQVGAILALLLVSALCIWVLGDRLLARPLERLLAAMCGSWLCCNWPFTVSGRPSAGAANSATGRWPNPVPPSRAWRRFLIA